ncbi:MAG: TetR/AcrR family transcriptional regulator [Gammaproteobacteria bacterium]|nr:TetR/AcrR family transcriptional regulator [Gammaproteobacteria bacterium]
MAKTADNSSEDIRLQILEAANVRFQQFGYGKTTMAEIAKDCGMSASNLYRFFENKLDIGAALAQRCLSECESRLRCTLDASLSATSQFETFVLEILRHTHDQWSKLPRLNEMVQTTISERPDIVEHHRQTKQALLIQIIEQGIARGEFDVADPKQVSETILVSITVLSVPMFMHLHSLEEFEQIARNIAHLILKGLIKC